VSNLPESKPPAGDDEPVPKLPRGRGIKLSFPEIMRILMISAMLVAVIVLRKPCADNTGRFIESFEPPVDAGYIRLSGEMTEEELRKKLDLEPEDAGVNAPAEGTATGARNPSEDTAHDTEPQRAPDPSVPDEKRPDDSSRPSQPGQPAPRP
jgi:hypothetical protein